MAFNKENFETACKAFITANGIVDANKAAFLAEVANCTRYTAKKFGEMVANIKTISTTIGGKTYTITADGVISLISMLETGDALAPKADANGVVSAGSDGNNIILGGEFVGGTVSIGGTPTLSSKNYTVNGDKIIINDTKIKDKAVVILDPVKSVVVNNVLIDNRNGNLVKTSTNSNSILKIPAGKCESIKLYKVVLCASEKQVSPDYKLYNGIEFWAGEKCKSILIEKCSFLGSYTHNAINIYSCANDATILVKDCYFDNFAQDGNILRLSNIPTTNNSNGASNVNIIFENCVFSHWDGEGINAESATKNEYAGFCLCQDYTSADGAADTKNLFGPDKIKITLKNCSGPVATYGGTGVIPAFEDQSTVCYNGAGTGFGNQLCYVYRDKGGILAYDAAKYPEIKVIPGAADLSNVDVVTSISSLSE